MRRALMFVFGLVLGGWIGNAWGRSALPAPPPGEHERLTLGTLGNPDAMLRVLRQPGPGRVTHFRSA